MNGNQYQNKIETLEKELQYKSNELNTKEDNYKKLMGIVNDKDKKFNELINQNKLVNEQKKELEKIKVQFIDENDKLN